MADPTVVNWIANAAKKTGADPVALLATSLVENGARQGLTPGDNGTSYGYFQMHQGGALGTHAPSWAATPAVALNRAQQFARLGVHGGKGAAAVQRPADPLGYAAKVDAQEAEARRLLGSTAPTKATAPVIHGSQLLSTLMAPEANDPFSAAIQRALNSNSQIAGTAPISLPVAPVTPQPGTATASVPRDPRTQPQVVPGTRGKVIQGAAKIIGGPFQGTHAVAFNERGGSNNWESERAVDIALPKGTPIYAPVSGVIGSQIGSLGSGGRFAGLRAHLVGGGNEFYFAHLSRLAVQAGQRVQRGQIIGYSGEANGVAHLHLATKTGSPGKYA